MVCTVYVQEGPASQLLLGFRIESFWSVDSSSFLTFLGFSLGNSRLFLLPDVEVKTYTSEMDSD